MPNKRISDKSKSKRGTDRADRQRATLVVLPTPSDLPKAPSWVPEGAATEEFDRLARHLHAAGVLSEPAVVPLGHLACLHAAIAKYWENGVIPQSALLSQYRLLGQEFGITPANANKLPSPPPKPENPFAHHGRRQRPSSDG